MKSYRDSYAIGSGQGRAVLESFLRRECCRMLDGQLAWTQEQSNARLQQD